MTLKKLIGCLLGLMVLTRPVWAQPPAGAGVLAEVIRLEETWLQSEKTNNTALLLPIIADGIVDTTTDGVLLSGKDAVIADAQAVKWSRAEYQNMQVSVFGDTAIATAIFDGKGTDSAARAVDVHEQFTDVWVKMPSGAWQCVATHGTLIKK